MNKDISKQYFIDSEDEREEAVEPKRPSLKKILAVVAFTFLTVGSAIFVKTRRSEKIPPFMASITTKCLTAKTDTPSVRKHHLNNIDPVKFVVRIKTNNLQSPSISFGVSILPPGPSIKLNDRIQIIGKTHQPILTLINKTFNQNKSRINNSSRTTETSTANYALPTISSRQRAAAPANPSEAVIIPAGTGSTEEAANLVHSSRRMLPNQNQIKGSLAQFALAVKLHKFAMVIITM